MYNGGGVYLDLLEEDLKWEGLVKVWVQGTLFNRSFLLLNTFPVLHQRKLNIWIW